MKFVKSTFYIVIITLVYAVNGHAGDALNDMKPYPNAETGQQRMVFRVPVSEYEGDKKVEIIVGKVIPVDCNIVSFSGNLDTETAQGWGYSYYVVNQIIGPSTTMMACPSDQALEDKFIKVRGNGYLVRYNSKLPYVVYTPSGFEVRYRVWAPTGATEKAQSE